MKAKILVKFRPRKVEHTAVTKQKMENPTSKIEEACISTAETVLKGKTREGYQLRCEGMMMGMTMMVMMMTIAMTMPSRRRRRRRRMRRRNLY